MASGLCTLISHGWPPFITGIVSCGISVLLKNKVITCICAYHEANKVCWTSTGFT